MNELHDIGSYSVPPFSFTDPMPLSLRRGETIDAVETEEGIESVCCLMQKHNSSLDKCGPSKLFRDSHRRFSIPLISLREEAKETQNSRLPYVYNR